jgi:hypothetical protein
MKLRFEPEKNEWDLPEAELQAELSKSLAKYDAQKNNQQQNRRFVITALFVTTAVIGATTTLIVGQFLPVLIGLIMYWNAYDLASKYVAGRN